MLLNKKTNTELQHSGKQTQTSLMVETNLYYSINERAYEQIFWVFRTYSTRVKILDFCETVFQVSICPISTRFFHQRSLISVVRFKETLQNCWIPIIIVTILRNCFIPEMSKSNNYVWIIPNKSTLFFEINEYDMIGTFLNLNKQKLKLYNRLI